MEGRASNQGAFEVKLSPGQYKGVVTPAEGSPIARYRIPAFTVGEETPTNLVVQSPFPHLVEGRILDPAGTPLPKTRVELYDLDEGAQGLLLHEAVLGQGVTDDKEPSGSSCHQNQGPLERRSPLMKTSVEKNDSFKRIVALGVALEPGLLACARTLLGHPGGVWSGDADKEQQGGFSRRRRKRRPQPATRNSWRFVLANTPGARSDSYPGAMAHPGP